MDAKLMTENEPIFTDDDKWDYFATLSDQLLHISMQIDTITLAASALGEVTGDLLALKYLSQKVWKHYRERGNAIVPDSLFADEGDE